LNGTIHQIGQTLKLSRQFILENNVKKIFSYFYCNVMKKIYIFFRKLHFLMWKKLYLEVLSRKDNKVKKFKWSHTRDKKLIIVLHYSHCIRVDAFLSRLNETLRTYRTVFLNLFWLAELICVVCVKDCGLHNLKYWYDNFICMLSCWLQFFTRRN